MAKIVRDAFQRALKRYLDDIFLICDTSFLNTDIILEKTNSLHPKINFTHETSDKLVPFLDILVMIKGTDVITDIYHKPTDSKQYLDYKSCHPRSTKNNVPFNLARRICTIVTNKLLRNRRLSELREVLLGRNYPPGVGATNIKSWLNRS